MKKKTILLPVILGIFLLCLICVYIGIAMHYSTHFLKNTQINKIDVSDMTVEEAEELIAADTENYRLVITGRDEEQETIFGADFDYTYVSDGKIQEYMDNQNCFAWLPEMMKGQSFSADISAEYSEEKLNNVVLGLSFMQEDQMTAPQNAYVALIEDGTYGIVPESEGTLLYADKVQEAVLKAVSEGKKALNLEMADCYVPADVTSENEKLLEEVFLRNTYSAMVINYFMSGEVIVTLDSSVFMKWFSLDENNNVSFDYDLVSAWVDELADEYDTIGLEEPFVTSNNKTVYVEAVTYGWEMDREAETEALYNRLMEGNTEGCSPVWKRSALTRGENDIGDTYVEIDYTNQRMWYYKNGELLVETPVVTGNVNAGNGSPEGIYYIVYKERNAKLKGEDYETPVDYWMPFYGNVGIHDADSWRSMYGGNIYLSSGSHGCINTPTAQAKTIYENIDENTPVICYSSGVDYGYAASETGISYISGSTEDTDNGDADIIIIYGPGSSDAYYDDGSSSDTYYDDSSSDIYIDIGDSDSYDGTWTAGGDAEFEIVISDEAIWQN